MSPLLDQPPIITGRFGSPITTKILTENVISNSLVYFCSPRVMGEPVFFSFSFPGLIPLMLSPDWMTDSATVSEETESVTDWGTDSETDSWALEAHWIDHC